MDGDPCIARPRHLGRGPAATLAALLCLVTPLLAASPAAAGTLVAPATAIPFGAAPLPTPIRHVIVVFLENQEAKDVLANGSYERSLASTFAYADQFYAPMHYSLPNYLAATSGWTTNYFAPGTHVNVGGLALSAGRTWKEYEESMPYPCDLAPSMTPAGYDSDHNPFALYQPFINHTSACQSHMVDFNVWNSDVAAHAVPNYALVVPNVTHDGHNATLSGAEAWLSQWLPSVMNQTFYRSSAIFVTYDEGISNLGPNGTTGGGRVYFALISPYARAGFVSETNYSTYSLLTTTEWLLGLGRTYNHDSWTTYPPLRELFAFPVPVSGQVVDALGTGIAGIAVSDHAGVTARTNASGGFVMMLRPGNYTLYVSQTSGYVGRLAVSVGTSPITGLVLSVRTAP